VSHAPLTLLLGWSAVAIGVVGTRSQFRRICTRGVAGVSIATWTLFVLMGCFWMSYGFVAHSWQVSMGSALAAPWQLAILVRLKVWEHASIVARSVAAFLACCVVPTVLFGWAGGVLGTGVAMTINRAPQLIELIRQVDASGVSAGSWYLGVLGCSLWIIYYTGVHLWAALAATSAAGVANLAIALLTSGRHVQARRRLVAEQVFAS